MSVPKISVNNPYSSAGSRSANWGHDETQVLVNVWEELDFQLSSEDTFISNKTIYTRAVRRLAEMGYDRTQPQIQFKLKQLKSKYRGLMAGKTRLGGGRPASHWEFFEQIHKIFSRTQQAWNDSSTSPRGQAFDSRESMGTRDSGLRQAKRSSKATASSSVAPSTSKSGTASDSTQNPATSQSGDAAIPTLPDVPESEDDDDEEDDDEEGDMEDTEGDDIQDLFGQIHRQEQELDVSAEVTENNGNKTTEPVFASYKPTAATKSNKRPSSMQQNPKRPRGRPKVNAPPREDLTIAQAITDATMRFIDHQSFHLTEQTKLLQRYLKFERARMRWEMDMETRRMKWEEEREMREEERRQRQEELQAKRVSDNREFMLQMAVVLGNGATSKDKDSTKN